MANYIYSEEQTKKYLYGYLFKGYQNILINGVDKSEFMVQKTSEKKMNLVIRYATLIGRKNFSGKAFDKDADGSKKQIDIIINTKDEQGNVIDGSEVAAAIDDLARSLGCDFGPYKIQDTESEECPHLYTLTVKINYYFGKELKPQEYQPSIRMLNKSLNWVDYNLNTVGALDNAIFKDISMGISFYTTTDRKNKKHLNAQLNWFKCREPELPDPTEGMYPDANNRPDETPNYFVDGDDSDKFQSPYDNPEDNPF